MKLVLAAAAAVAFSAAAFAATDPMTGVPAADQTMIVKCKAMTHDAMMKTAMCIKMMKLYPAAFSGSVSSN